MSQSPPVSPLPHNKASGNGETKPGLTPGATQARWITHHGESHQCQRPQDPPREAPLERPKGHTGTSRRGSQGRRRMHTDVRTGARAQAGAALHQHEQAKTTPGQTRRCTHLGHQAPYGRPREQDAPRRRQETRGKAGRAAPPIPSTAPVEYARY